MKLDKRLVDDVIRLTKKYYKTGDEDYLLQALLEAEKALKKSAPWQVVQLLGDLAQYTQRGKGTYEDIYRALAAFGIIVEDKGVRK